MAVSYWAFLKAARPLLSWSRAFNLLQPERPAARIAIAANVKARRNHDRRRGLRGQTRLLRGVSERRAPTAGGPRDDREDLPELQQRIHQREEIHVRYDTVPTCH